MGRAIYLSDLVTALEETVEARGISYRTAAVELDVSPQRLSQWRRGARIDWSAALQKRIAAFLGVSPLDVLEMDGLDVSTDPVDAANLADDASPVPGLVARLNYPDSSGRFHPCASRTRMVTYGRPTYRHRPTSWVGATCTTSGTSCVARV